MLDPFVNPSIPIVAGIVFLAVALLVARRAGRHRRIARRVRAQQESRVNISRGTLAATPLRDLMRAIAEFRASGMLELVAATESYSLFFLFGRIYHAVGPGIEGEAALGRALRLADALYRFDSKVRLPRQTTITTTVPEAAVPEASRAR